MKKDYSALSFSEKERICENEFMTNGPFWHIYTDGTRMQNIFCTKEEFEIGLWMLASTRCMCPKVRLATFELMENHGHLILCGQKENCIEFFEIFFSRLRRTLSRIGRIINWDNFQMGILPINSLQDLRNEIIYTNRNAFVANGNYTPDSYPWGGGCAFFNGWIDEIPTVLMSSLPINKQRRYLHTKDVAPFKDLHVIGNRPFIPSFCDIKLAERMFRDPRSYFYSLTRNAEAFSQIANRLGDRIFLTDEELYSVMTTHTVQEYGQNKPSQLTPQQRLDVARYLRLNYNATNQQLRRILRIDISILSELFPQ